MSTHAAPLVATVERHDVHSRPLSSRWFNWAMTIACGWIVAGAYTDLWAHTHGKVDTSFFTPYHGLLYSGLLAAILLVGIVSVCNVLRGYHWMNAAPVGYTTALLGAALFAFGGASDLIWHTLLGIEVNIDALLSPPHLLIGLGAFMLVSGPLVADWARPSARIPLTGLLSAVYTLAIINFFTNYVHPVATPLADLTTSRQLLAGVRSDVVYQMHALGVASFLIQSALVCGLILLLLRRWQLPIGAVTLIMTLSVGLIATSSDFYQLIGPAAAAGVVGDLLLVALRPSLARLWAVRLWALLLPLAFFGFQLAILAGERGLAWTMNMWSGATFLAALAGVLVSFLVFPPTIPTLHAQETTGL